jgi:hypothetical protein
VPNSRSLETLTADDFRDFVGTSFQLTAGSPEDGSSAGLGLELAEVTGFAANAAPGAARVPFSLLFHGPLQPVVPQGVYRLAHAQLGEFEPFIVPVGPAVCGQAPVAMRYEIVFG